MHSLARLLAFAAFAAVALPQFAAAQQHMNMPGMDMHESKSTAPYRPGLGDLMTTLVQPRHIKLGLAGQAQNWPYAAYELGELREAFDTVAKLVLKHGKLVIADALGATVKQPLAALDTAIKAKDEPGFTAAYAALTQSCNACHQSADHPAIVIQVPTASPFPDQDFRPPKP